MELSENFTLSDLQSITHRWRVRNFPHTWSDHMLQLLGVVEEVGELSHAVVKQEQGIRGSKEALVEDEKDAIADLIIFLTGYCSARGFDLQRIVYETWEDVSRRDWVNFPKNGVDE